jgi:cytochrome c biogenesis protein CcmG/thiol:disulfide interchange protein DsbE
MRRVTLVVTMLALLPACGGADGARPRGSLLPGDPLALPEYDLATYRELIAEHRGTPVVVNFWGSWCVPCRAEAPHLATVSEELAGRVQFLGVDIADDRAGARAFIREFGWRYPSVFDPDEEIHNGLGLFGQPNTLIYDRSGAVVWQHTGAVDAKMLREHIDDVL